MNDRCDPMRRARRGHGRRGRPCSKPAGDGRQLGRRVGPVLGDQRPRWHTECGAADLGYWAGTSPDPSLGEPALADDLPVHWEGRVAFEF